MMEQQKKPILFEHYFLYVLYDGAREKTHSVITLFFVCCLWWNKRKNWFCYNIIFWMLSMMEKENKRSLKNSFCYNIIIHMLSMMKQEQKNHFYQTHFVITLFFLSCLWWSNRKKRFLKNWFCYNIIFCILSMIQ